MENKNILTKEQLIGCTAGLDSRDFAGFAARVKKINPAVGKTVELHAEAADGNSPDLAEWLDGTMRDAEALAKMDINTPAAANVYWMVEYTEQKPDEDEVDEWFRTVYGRDPDDSDREVGVFSLVCAGVR